MIQFIVPTWQFILYFLVLGVTFCLVARLAYVRGKINGRIEERADQEALLREEFSTVPRRFMQREPGANSPRTARVSKARLMARRQPKPEPRRGERDKQQ